MFDNFADSALYLLSSKFALPFSSMSPVKGVMKGTLTITILKFHLKNLHFQILVFNFPRSNLYRSSIKGQMMPLKSLGGRLFFD